MESVWRVNRGREVCCIVRWQNLCMCQVYCTESTVTHQLPNHYMLRYLYISMWLDEIIFDGPKQHSQLYRSRLAYFLACQLHIFPTVSTNCGEWAKYVCCLS